MKVTSWSQVDLADAMSDEEWKGCVSTDGAASGGAELQALNITSRAATLSWKKRGKLDADPPRPHRGADS